MNSPSSRFRRKKLGGLNGISLLLQPGCKKQSLCVGELREEDVVPPFEEELVNFERKQCFRDLGTHIIYKPNPRESRVG